MKPYSKNKLILIAFAKATWGTKLVWEDFSLSIDGDTNLLQPVWEFHLQKMLLAKNPFKYLTADQRKGVDAS